MLSNLFFIHPEKKFSKGFKRVHATHVHHAIALPLVGLLALSAALFCINAAIEINAMSDTIVFELYFPRAFAQENPKMLRDFTSIDVMKLTKDVVTNQPSPAQIENIVSTLSQLHARYVAVSVPLDATADYPKTQIPAPQTAEAFTKTWADAIHRHNMLVLWRGTWSGIEGIYEYKKLVGTSRFPAGTAASALTDGNTTWLGKTYGYIMAHPDYFQNGDIWAPMPERTEGIFQDSTSFLPYDGAGIQSNYAAFFNNVKKVSDVAFTAIGKNVYTGWTANNFSEIQSGWLNTSIYGTAGLVVTDYYGTSHTPEEMEKNITDVYVKTGRQVFLQEWSDYWDGSLSDSQRQLYLSSMYSVFQNLADRKILAGFNYWGGWSGTVESILIKTSAGYELNARGLQLSQFFAQNSL